MVARTCEAIVDLIGGAGAVDGNTQSSVGIYDLLLLICKILIYPHLPPAAQVHPRRIEDAGHSHRPLQVRDPLQPSLADVLVGDPGDLDGADGNQPLCAVDIAQSYQNLHHPGQGLPSLAPIDSLFLRG